MNLADSVIYISTSERRLSNVYFVMNVRIASLYRHGELLKATFAPGVNVRYVVREYELYICTSS